MNKRSVGICKGIGVNDADYVVAYRVKNEDGSIKQVVCPFYQKWVSMIKRCYSDKALSHDPTYVETEVCEEWHLFSNFKRWMEQQDWENKQLDKDILGNGKLYSPKTCCFVSFRVNMFIKNSYNNKHNLPGVYYDKQRKRYKFQIYDIYKRKRVLRGHFKTPEEAHFAWVDYKLSLLARLIEDEELDENITKALYAKINDIKEIV